MKNGHSNEKKRLKLQFLWEKTRSGKELHEK